jgi:AraC-like DNA-binding protein
MEGLAAAPVPYATITRYIAENVSRRIAVKELAALAHVSVFDLCRAFRRDGRTTPYRLVLAVRVSHASGMLAAGATIAEAATQTGFADQSHFTRHFKRVTGMTPRQFATSCAPAPRA